MAWIETMLRDWGRKAYKCPLCGWQGTAKKPPWRHAECPECGEHLVRQSWLETYGLTLLILGVVVATVLFVAYFGQGRFFME